MPFYSGILLNTYFLLFFPNESFLVSPLGQEKPVILTHPPQSGPLSFYDKFNHMGSFPLEPLLAKNLVTFYIIRTLSFSGNCQQLLYMDVFILRHLFPPFQPLLDTIRPLNSLAVLENYLSGISFLGSRLFPFNNCTSSKK